LCWVTYPTTRVMTVLKGRPKRCHTASTSILHIATAFLFVIASEHVSRTREKDVLKTYKKLPRNVSSTHSNDVIHSLKSWDHNQSRTPAGIARERKTRMIVVQDVFGSNVGSGSSFPDVGSGSSLPDVGSGSSLPDPPETPPHMQGTDAKVPIRTIVAMTAIF